VLLEQAFGCRDILLLGLATPEPLLYLFHRQGVLGVQLGVQNHTRRAITLPGPRHDFLAVDGQVYGTADLRVIEGGLVVMSNLILSRHRRTHQYLIV
jgi:hypothetical protein